VLTGLSLDAPADISTFTLVSQSGAQQFTFATETTGALDAGGPFDPSWDVIAAPFGALYFDGFGSGGKPIIGPATNGDTTYASANASLTSGPHGTYIYQTATFTLSAPGVFDPSTLSGVTFRFNTDGETTVPGVGSGTPRVPEPASLAILGLGAVALIKRRK
jgi:hypothetical protein